MTLLVVYVAFALGFSFMCSVLEAVLLSVTPGYIGRLKQDRPSQGARLERLKSNVDRPLAAILSLNTLANTAGAAGAGAQAQVVFGSEVLALASAILTLLVLIISEIIPKTLGAVYWRQLAPAMTRVLPLLIFCMSPFVWLSKFITRLIKKDDSKKTNVSKEEIAALARLASEQGVFDASESRILANLFRLASPSRSRHHDAAHGHVLRVRGADRRRSGPRRRQGRLPRARLDPGLLAKFRSTASLATT